MQRQEQEILNTILKFLKNTNHESNEGAKALLISATKSMEWR